MKKPISLLVAVLITAVLISCSTEQTAAPPTHTPTALLRPTSTTPPTLTNTLIPPTPSPILTITATPVPFGKEVLIGFDFETNDLYLLDLQTGEKRKLSFEHTFGGVSWIGDGCEIIISTINHGIVGIDLYGNITRQIISLSDYPSGTEFFFPNLNSTGEFLAYFERSNDPEMEVYGGYLMSVSLDDLFIYNFQNESSFKISQASSVSSMAWSPDGKQIAFSDLGANGVHQLFVYSIETDQLTQLTDFSDLSTLVAHSWAPYKLISWSPDSAAIAFVKTTMIDSDTEVGPPDELYLGFLGNQNRLKTVELPEYIHFIFSIQWKSENELIIDGADIHWDSKFLILDIETGEINLLLLNEMIDPLPLPVQMGSPNEIVFRDRNTVYHKLNIETLELVHYGDMGIWFRSYYAPPFGFEGEASCMGLDD